MHVGAALVVFLTLAASAMPLPQATTSRPKPKAQKRPAAPLEGMTNKDVIQMVSAGLSDQIIIGAVQQAPARKFDLSVAGLLGLKKAAVSDTLILFMQTSEAPADTRRPDAVPATRPSVAEEIKAAAPLPAGVPAIVRAEDGVYYVGGAGVQRIEAKTPYQTRTGSKAVSRLTFGIKKARLNAMLPGLTADIQASQSPQFYVHLADAESVGEYYLIKFTVKQEQGRRELEVGSAGLGKAQSGFAEKDIFLIEAKRLEKDLYLVTPKVALSAGEYSLLVVPQATSSSQTGLTPRKIFDFSVR